MALGSTAIHAISEQENTINTEIDRITDCWNTFNYVIENLGAWEDETIIGKELVNDLTAFTNRIKELIDSSKKLSKNIDEFITNQIRINRG